MRDILEQARLDVFVDNVRSFYFARKKLCKNILTVLCCVVGGAVWLHYERVEQMETASFQFLRAIQEVEAGNVDRALHTLDHMPSKYTTIYSMLARFLAADSMMYQHDSKKAEGVYKGIMADTKGAYQNLAAMKYLYLVISHLPFDEANSMLSSWMQRAPGWRVMLQEMQAYVCYHHGKIQEAVALYDTILRDETLDENVRLRLQLSRLMCLKEKSL